MPAVRSIESAVSPGDGACASLGEIAGLVRYGSGAMVCAIAWNSDESDGTAFAPEQQGPWRELAQSLLAALARRVESYDTRKSAYQLALSTSELAALLDGDAVSAAACVRREGAAQTRMVVLAPIERRARELEKVAELGCRAALAALGEQMHAATRTFWRRRGAEAAETSSRARAELAVYREREQAVADLFARSRELRVRDRFTSLGRLLASSGRFEEWMVALAGPQGLEVFASGPVAARHESSNFPGTASDEQPIAIVGGNVVLEARFLRRPYTCLPFESGAIVLSSRTPISETQRTRLSDTVARFAPILKSWRVELELETQRTLTRQLAYRMFNAVDQERVRIARDLHDDHAQLITATSLALRGGGEQARAMLEQIEHELRRKIRELRPASLGRMSLARALSMETARLRDAGIEATLSGVAVAAKLSRPVQNLGWQFVREALANVVQHARASRVELSVARRNGRVVISARDNGKGIEEDAAGKGSGLSGMRERLSLIGGSLRIDSRPGATVLTAEIPDPS